MELREYQNDCTQACASAIQSGTKLSGVIAPTGSGKTVVFGAFIKDYLDETELQERNKVNAAGRTWTQQNVQALPKVVVISHLGLLTQQTTKRFKKDWDIDAGILQADKYPDRHTRCVITTMQSFREESKLDYWAGMGSFFSMDRERLNVKIIIIDEGHFLGAKSYQDILGYFPNVQTICFTATPFRENKLMTDMFDQVIYTISMQELIDLGHLVPPDLRLVDFDVHDQASLFASIINVYKTNHSGEKAVVYMKSIEEAELLRNVLIQAGIKSSAVTSKLTGDARDEVLERYTSGHVEGAEILTTVDVLTAGFDSPNIRAIFMPYKVGSITTYLQRVGRGLRPDEDKDCCKIYAGANSPGIKPGFWEKITTQILKAGAKSYDDYSDEIEYLKEQMSAERFEWTQGVVDLAKDVAKRGMAGISEAILKKEFPPELLDVFVARPPMSVGKKGQNTEMTPGQWGYLKNNNLPTKGISKQEASNIIRGHKLANGWKPAKIDIVPEGKHQGRLFEEVPYAYWNVLRMKQPRSGAYTSYLAWKKQRRKP